MQMTGLLSVHSSLQSPDDLQDAQKMKGYGAGKAAPSYSAEGISIGKHLISVFWKYPSVENIHLSIYLAIRCYFTSALLKFSDKAIDWSGRKNTRITFISSIFLERDLPKKKTLNSQNIFSVLLAACPMSQAVENLFFKSL